MSRFDAVVFDLDNTLCRNSHDTGALYDRAFERVGVEPFGRPEELWAALDGPPDPDDSVSYFGAGFARLAAKYGQTDIDPIALAEALAETIDHSQVEFLPGAERALDRARAVGRVGVLTNGPRRRQEPKIRALGLHDRVDEIVYAGDLSRRKPHREPFDAMLSALGVPAEKALYVGDSLGYDVAGAQNAGLAVAWLRGDDDAGDYHPEYVIDSLTELDEVLDE
ncbi:HAD-IA family hydrolase [Halovenus sp. WSH3]|uniref:HAD-IA family hydrolase n=1 Tax=Halovenus carboxidivorans TaxID=2692199 RepID=A0A6B0T806_9EURY|nr:HAD-IA family hydrolase [Halovenus carboxidivorans]